MRPLTTTNQTCTLMNIASFPHFSWTSYHDFTNPLALPLNNIPEDNELFQSSLHKLTTAVHQKQFTTIGLSQTLNRYRFRKSLDKVEQAEIPTKLEETENLKLQ